MDSSQSTVMHIIWDLDGTLIDVKKGVYHSFNTVARKHGYRTIPYSRLEKIIAISQIKVGFQVTYDLEEQEANVCADEFREVYLKNFLYDAALFPNILDVLASFYRQGIRQGIATNKGAEHATRICAFFGINKFCSPIIGAPSLHTTKKDIIELFLKDTRWKVKSDTYMIGDTESDREAAESFGMKFIGVNYGYGFNACPRCANSPMEILKILRK